MRNPTGFGLAGILITVVIITLVVGGYFLLNKKQDSEKFLCQTNEDCVKYKRACSEVCVNNVYMEKNPYDGPQCLRPWRNFDCQCNENKCEVNFK